MAVPVSLDNNANSESQVSYYPLQLLPTANNPATYTLK